MRCTKGQLSGVVAHAWEGKQLALHLEEIVTHRINTFGHSLSLVVSSPEICQRAATRGMMFFSEGERRKYENIIFRALVVYHWTPRLQKRKGLPTGVGEKHIKAHQYCRFFCSLSPWIATGREKQDDAVSKRLKRRGRRTSVLITVQTMLDRVYEPTVLDCTRISEYE